MKECSGWESRRWVHSNLDSYVVGVRGLELKLLWCSQLLPYILSIIQPSKQITPTSLLLTLSSGLSDLLVGLCDFLVGCGLCDLLVGCGLCDLLVGCGLRHGHLLLGLGLRHGHLLLGLGLGCCGFGTEMLTLHCNCERKVRKGEG